MKPYLLLLLVLVAGKSYAAGDCKLKNSDGMDIEPSKYIYTGECKNGYADGKGKYIWSGARYEGDFKNGKRDGKGVYIWSDGGDRYDGDFKNNLIDGKGIYIYSNGSRYEGDFKDVLLNGFARKYTSSGELEKEGFYIKGKFIKECSRTECDPNYAIYADLDQKTKNDIVMNKITAAIKEERYKDALPYFFALERKNNNLPESFYFYQIQSFSKAGFTDVAKDKGKDYLKKYGSKGKYYAEVIEIMGR